MSKRESNDVQQELSEREGLTKNPFKEKEKRASSTIREYVI